SSVGEVHAALPPHVDVAFNTVQSILRILEDKGYAKHRTSGRTFIYRAVIDRQQASTSALDQVVRRFFDNSPESLALNIVDSDALTAEELERLQRRIAEVRKRK